MSGKVVHPSDTTITTGDSVKLSDFPGTFTVTDIEGAHYHLIHDWNGFRTVAHVTDIVIIQKGTP